MHGPCRTEIQKAQACLSVMSGQYNEICDNWYSSCINICLLWWTGARRGSTFDFVIASSFDNLPPHGPWLNYLKLLPMCVQCHCASINGRRHFTHYLYDPCIFLHILGQQHHINSCRSAVALAIKQVITNSFHAVRFESTLYVLRFNLKSPGLLEKTCPIYARVELANVIHGWIHHARGASPSSYITSYSHSRLCEKQQS